MAKLTHEQITDEVKKLGLETNKWGNIRHHGQEP